MRNRLRTILAVILALSLTGCAISPQQFYAERAALSNVDTCRAFESARKSGNREFMYDAARELNARNISLADCSKLIDESNATAGKFLAGVAAVALVAVVVAAASRGGGGGSGYVPHTTDRSWSWDQYYNQYGQLVWSCRGEQTGQFAALSQCSGKYKSDHTWPSKQARAN